MLCTFKVEVQTSDVRGAGTDADVRICVSGVLGDTGSHDLHSSHNDFERNMLDTFMFMVRGRRGGERTECPRHGSACAATCFFAVLQKGAGLCARSVRTCCAVLCGRGVLVYQRARHVQTSKVMPRGQEGESIIWPATDYHAHDRLHSTLPYPTAQHTLSSMMRILLHTLGVIQPQHWVSLVR